MTKCDFVQSCTLLGPNVQVMALGARASKTCAKLLLHLAWDALRKRKNYRFHHCFREEDSMMWLKCTAADIACISCLVSIYLWYSVGMWC